VVQAFSIGDVVIFKGYSQLEPGQEALLTEGQKVRVDGFNPDGSLIVRPVEGEGPGDSVYPEEIEGGAEALAGAAQAQAEAEIEAAKPKKASKKAASRKSKKASRKSKKAHRKH
jgi:hypothetical protein